MIDCQTETPNEMPVVLHVGRHSFRADTDIKSGGKESAPSPHDYFDSALAACKALTVTIYARARNIPLERIETHVERDDSQERQGTYRLNVKLAFHGPLTAEQRQKLHEIADKCPLHKLMTKTEILIETSVLDPVVSDPVG